MAALEALDLRAEGDRYAAAAQAHLFEART